MQKEIKEYTGKLSKVKYTFSEIIHNHRHYLLLLYWPLFGLAFNIAESGKFTDVYHLIRCGLDAVSYTHLGKRKLFSSSPNSRRFRRNDCS